MKNYRRSGFTLIEVIIASVILTALVLMAMMALFSATDVSMKGGHASELEERGKRFLALCRDEMASGQFGGTLDLGLGSPLSLGACPPPPYPPSGTLNYLQTPNGVSTYNLAVGYQLPGVWNQNGAQMAGTKVVYGYNCPFNLGLATTTKNPAQFIQNLACYLRFEADTVFKESVSSPNAVQAANWDSGNLFPPYPTLTNPSSSVLRNQILDMDINGDGDRTDTYVRGKVVRLIYAPIASYVAGLHSNPIQLSIVNGGTVTMSPLLLSREVVSDNVLLRVNSTTAGDFYCDFDGHTAAKHSDEEVLFRYVDASGTVNTAPLGSIQSPADATNALGILVTVVHGDYDGSKKGFIWRKSSELIRFHSPQGVGP